MNDQQANASERRDQIYLGIGMALGIGVGLGLGALIGKWAGNIEMWLGLGIPVGCVIGLIFSGGISELAEKRFRKQKTE
jgi:hypothetical protein